MQFTDDQWYAMCNAGMSEPVPLPVAKLCRTHYVIDRELAGPWWEMIFATMDDA
jgi:hypothetical protein